MKPGKYLCYIDHPALYADWKLKPQYTIDLPVGQEIDPFLLDTSVRRFFLDYLEPMRKKQFYKQSRGEERTFMELVLLQLAEAMNQKGTHDGRKGAHKLHIRTSLFDMCKKLFGKGVSDRTNNKTLKVFYDYLTKLYGNKNLYGYKSDTGKLILEKLFFSKNGFENFDLVQAWGYMPYNGKTFVVELRNIMAQSLKENVYSLTVMGLWLYIFHADENRALLKKIAEHYSKRKFDKDWERYAKKLVKYSSFAGSKSLFKKNDYGAVIDFWAMACANGVKDFESSNPQAFKIYSKKLENDILPYLKNAKEIIGNIKE
ncbi:MAG: hypothetical protein GY754_03815 [bacterium]|nr:hypothetical protein [bacterium]